MVVLVDLFLHEFCLELHSFMLELCNVQIISKYAFCETHTAGNYTSNGPCSINASGGKQSVGFNFILHSMAHSNFIFFYKTLSENWSLNFPKDSCAKRINITCVCLNGTTEVGLVKPNIEIRDEGIFWMKLGRVFKRPTTYFLTFRNVVVRRSKWRIH